MKGQDKTKDQIVPTGLLFATAPVPMTGRRAMPQKDDSCNKISDLKKKAVEVLGEEYQCVPDAPSLSFKDMRGLARACQVHGTNSPHLLALGNDLLKGIDRHELTARIVVPLIGMVISMMAVGLGIWTTRSTARSFCDHRKNAF
jgi:hypothetical protein